MQNEDEQRGAPITDEELDKINGISKPEGMTPEQEKEWQDWEHDMKLLRDDALAPASAFKVMYKKAST